MEIEDTLDFLLGVWRVNRYFDDALTLTRGHFSGSAILSYPEHPSFSRRARYHESGELTHGEHMGPAARSLEYDDDGSGIVTVYFVDGSRFIDLDLRTRYWESLHHCGDDLYEIATTVRSSDDLEEFWRVTGSDKSYSALTHLTRIK